MKGIFILGVILIQAALCQYQYTYNKHPLHSSDFHYANALTPGHSHAGGHGSSIYGSTNPQVSQSMLDLILRSLVNPAASPNTTVSSSSDFVRLWNTQFGYNFTSIGAIQENIGCRARCLRLTESPVCGVNGTRYFNSCDAECDQVSYSTANLRYNNKCCCDDNEISAAVGDLFCLTDPLANGGTVYYLSVTRCMMKCLSLDYSTYGVPNGTWGVC